MGNNHIIFLHIQIEYLKCEFWEFESTQKHLWLIFNKCLKLEKVLFCYFCCMCSTIIQGLQLIYLGRENSQLSIEIGFINFGSLDIFEMNFEQGIWTIWNPKWKALFEFMGQRGKNNWADPSN